MKKIVLPFLALGLIFMASCAKEYSCECAYNDGSGTVENTFIEGTVRTKKKAEDDCATNESELKFFYPNISCSAMEL